MGNDDGGAKAKVGYREFKILLLADRFADPSAFHELWKIIKQAAEGLEIEAEKSASIDAHQIREVLFYDTAKNDLYNHSFILRKRTLYQDGFAQPGPEVTLKLRSEDIAKAAAADMRPRVGENTDAKFKEEILVPRDGSVGMRSVYSNNCDIDPAVAPLDGTIAHLARVVPAVVSAASATDAKLAPVGTMVIEEVEAELGKLDFGHHLSAKLSAAIWRDRAAEKALIGELSYQCKLRAGEPIDEKAKRRSEELYTILQTAASAWVSRGTTKTAIVYGSAGGPVNNDE